MNPLGPDTLYFGRLLIVDSNSLIDLGLFTLSISWWILSDYVFRETDWFYVDYQICGRRLMHSIPLLSF